MEPQITDNTPTPGEAKKNLNISIPAAIVTGAAIIGLALFLALGPKNGTPQQPQGGSEIPTAVPTDITKIKEGEFIRGATNPSVVVIEYSDSDCPFCKQFHDTMTAVVDSYKGAVGWVYRFFPLESLHPNATTEAAAIICAGELGGNDAFWSYLDTVMNVTLNADPKSNEALVTFATAAGLDGNLFRSCLKNPDTSPIEMGIAEARAIGARGTPFSVAVNLKTGEQVVIPGAQPLEKVKEAIDSIK